MKTRVIACAMALVVCGCSGKKIADADLYNVQAAVGAGLPYPVMEWKAITVGGGVGMPKLRGRCLGMMRRWRRRGRGWRIRRGRCWGW